LRYRLLIALICAVWPAFPVAKEILQLQRDMALLQEQIRSLQRGFDTELAKSQQLLNQNLEASGRLATSIAVLEKSVHNQEKVLAAPVATVNTRVDTMASQFQSLRDAVDEMNSRLAKLQQQIVDIKNIVSTVPPPQAAPAPTAQAAAPVAPVQSATLWTNALRDYQAGNFDLAGPQFTDYLKYFGTSEQASEAQYYLGEIFYQQKQYKEAVDAYDLVLERYPEGKRTPDAQYKKGLALLRMNRRDMAAKEFREVIRRFPRTPAATQAADALKGLGLAIGPSSRPSPSKSATRRR
jgi:tol-pal system protein YbgF